MKLISGFILISLAISCNSSEPGPTPDSETTDKFISTPKREIDHNREYKYSPKATFEGGDTIIYTLESGPSWLYFDEKSISLKGIPGWDNEEKEFTVTIKASNGLNSVFQSFMIQVQLGEIICDSYFGEPSVSEYILPYEVGESYKVNQSYCPPNPNWGHHNWFAYDFEMPIGTKVLAMRDGQAIATVEHYADGTRVCGEENLILILQNDGSVASYYHLTKNGVFVNNGDYVQKGQIIGLSGDSGCSIGPHLHIAVFRQLGKHFRQYTIPINFFNTDGPLDGNNGMIYNETYEALPL